MKRTYFEHQNIAKHLDESLSNVDGVTYISQPRTITITQRGLDFIESNKEIDDSSPHYNSYKILNLLKDTKPHYELELQTKSNMDLSNVNYTMNLLKVSGLIYTN